MNTDNTPDAAGNAASDTPRTNHAELYGDDGPELGTVSADHARQLERELNQARAETFAARIRTNEAMRDRDNAIKERDEARECLREAIAETDAGDNAWLIQNTIARWRKAAGIDMGEPRG